MSAENNAANSEPPAGQKPKNKNKGGRPPVLDEYARGKLVMALACGMTQREAAMWAGTGSPDAELIVRGSRVAQAAIASWPFSMVGLRSGGKLQNTLFDP